MELKCTLDVNVKSNDRGSVLKVALKRAYKMWWAGLGKHGKCSLGEVRI